MPRTARVAPGGMVFHVLNRGVGRMQLFDKAGDFQAFERVLEETCHDTPMRICAYALMPNHWHLLLWPQHDGDLASFMQRLTITHVRRWQEHRHDVDWGTSTRADISRFPSNATSISGRSPAMSSGTRSGPIWCCERKSGVGPVSGGEFTARRRSSRCWRIGPLAGNRTGSNG